MAAGTPNEARRQRRTAVVTNSEGKWKSPSWPKRSRQKLRTGDLLSFGFHGPPGPLTMEVTEGTPVFRRQGRKLASANERRP